MNNSIWDPIIDELEKDYFQVNADKNILLSNIERLKNQKLNILFAGATGVGKSSTINAIFNTGIAKVGYSVEPETSSIQKYEIDNLILWDTPGLGDSPENDKKYAAEIANALKAKNSEGELLIDLVVVMIDGSNRDMKTSYELIEKVIVPFISDTNRLIIAINQCDLALKGRYWNHIKNEPDEQLVYFLEQKSISVRNRIKASINITTQPIFYSALHRYNISKLLLTMLKILPENKRFLFTDSLNKKPEVWEKNDVLEDYNIEIQKEIKSSLMKALDGAAKGAVAGKTVGNLIPIVGPTVGASVGAVLGFLGGLIE